jgi:RNA polymerase sigma-70 factor (ECF subfamily)
LQNIDPAIVLKAARGDSKAFEIIVRAFQGSVFSIAWRLSRNRDDALDLSQEIFLHLYNNLHKYDPEKPFKPWLYRVAANFTLNYMKKKKLKTVSLDAVMEKRPIADPRSLPAYRIVQYEEHSQLNEAVSQLPPTYGLPIALYYAKGLSIKEIANAMSLAEQTVKIRLFRARELLREKLTGSHG